MNREKNKVETRTRLETHFIPTSRLKAYDVVNEAGEDLGQVQNFIVDMVSGRIAYVLVSFAGLLGLTDRWVALPFTALAWQPERNHFRLDVPRALLMQAPGIKRADWPERFLTGLEQRDHAAWVEDVYRHFNRQPFWAIEVADYESDAACR